MPVSSTATLGDLICVPVDEFKLLFIHYLNKIILRFLLLSGGHNEII